MVQWKSQNTINGRKIRKRFEYLRTHVRNQWTKKHFGRGAKLGLRFLTVEQRIRKYGCRITEKQRIFIINHWEIGN